MVARCLMSWHVVCMGSRINPAIVYRRINNKKRNYQRVALEKGAVAAALRCGAFFIEIHEFTAEGTLK